MSDHSSHMTARVWSNPRPEGWHGPACSDTVVVPNVAEIWLCSGQVPLSRILVTPAPGTATPEDAVQSRKKLGINCELVNGTLVAKTMGFYESHVAMILAYFIQSYLMENPIGLIAGEDGPYLLLPRNVRKPDVSVITFARLPRGTLPPDAICPIAPDLAAEVLSRGNSVAEMELKRKQYFGSGVRLVWEINPQTKSARAYTAADQFQDIPCEGVLRGGEVLPGFELPLIRLFEKAGPPST